MPRQILTLKLDGITAGDYLAWCRDPDPPALGSALRSVHVDADPFGDKIIATLDWSQPAPPPPAAAAAAGLPLLAGTHAHALGPARRQPTRSRLGSPERAQAKHELALALTDLGGATFALTYHGALNDERLGPRVQRIRDLFTQLDGLDHPTRMNAST
jgi:hypothetical protein